MINIVDDAIEKIVAAYAPNNRIVSRLEATAIILRFRCDVAEKKVLPAIDDEQRRDLLVVLQLCLTDSISTHFHLQSPLLYPRALMYAFRNAGRDPKTYDARRTQNFVRQVENSATEGAFIGYLDEAAKLAFSDDPFFRSTSLTDMLAKTALVFGTRNMMKAAFIRATGFCVNELRSIRSELHNMTNMLEPEVKYQAVAGHYMPAVGPHTSDSLLFTLRVLMVHAQTDPMQLGATVLKERMNTLYGHVRALNSDIDAQHLQRVFQQRKTQFVNLPLWNAGIDPGRSATMMIGMTRFYLEHHTDQIPRETRLTITEAMQALYIEQLERDFVASAKLGEPLTDEMREHALRTMLERTWAAMPRPTVEDVVYLYERRLKGRALASFLEILKSSSAMFEPSVAFYAPQNEQLSKLRRGLFKQGDFTNGSDPHKVQFIRHLAANERDTLIQYGFSNDDMDVMAGEGKIPDVISRKLGGLTVDHIIDLHCGGTNHLDNFCLMPSALNADKNKFLLVQTGIYTTDAERQAGHWVLTLRPKATPNGGRSSILIPPILMPADMPENAPLPSPPRMH